MSKWILSYCPYQESYHIQKEDEFWEDTLKVYRQSKFEGYAYVPIKQFGSYEEYAIWMSENSLNNI